MKSVFNVLSKVYRRPAYITLTVLVTFIALTAVLWYQNWSLLFTILGSESSLLQKLHFFASLYGGLLTNFTIFGLIALLTTTLLFGVYLTLLTFYIRRAQVTMRSSARSHGTGVAGLVASVLGIGCAACGSLVLSSLAPLLGAGALLSIMPLHGGEFSLIGAGLLLYALWQLARKIDSPTVCDID